MRGSVLQKGVEEGLNKPGTRLCRGGRTRRNKAERAVSGLADQKLGEVFQALVLSDGVPNVVPEKAPTGTGIDTFLE